MDKKDRFNILLTLFAAILPVGISWLVKSNNTPFPLIIGRNENYLIQTVFIFGTLLVLIRHFWDMHIELTENGDKIKSYIAKDCNIKIFCKELESSFDVVQGTVRQFYVAWIVIWLLWLTYYLGNLLFAMSNTENTTFSSTLDFLTSTVIFAVYLILTNVTVNVKKRLRMGITYFYGIVIWVIILILWIVGIFLSKNVVTVLTFIPVNIVIYKDIVITPFEAENLVNLLLSLYSTITFTLVLGKINSNYLQIPRMFLLGLYLYAIIQAYHPFISNGYQIGVVGEVLKVIFPYMTLLGKFFLLLTLCWIANKRRFLFFVIQKSISIDETPLLLNNLNKECDN